LATIKHHLASLQLTSSNVVHLEPVNIKAMK